MTGVERAVPLDWPTLLAGDRTQPLPETVPDDILAKLSSLAVDRAPRWSPSAHRVFWSANRAPDLSLVPRVVALTAYQCIRQENAGAWCRIAAAYPWLQRLTIVGGDLATLPDELPELSRIVELGLKETAVARLPRLLTRMPYLRRLNWVGAGVAEVDPGLDGLPLTRLAIGGTPRQPAVLGTLPELPELTHLELSHAPRFAVPLTRFPRVVRLSIRGQVGEGDLAEAVGDLHGLRDLALADHPRTGVPTDVRRLTGLVTLYLVHTRLAALPEWLPDLGHLEDLALFGSHDLDPEQVVAIVGQLPRLTRLQLWDGFPPKSRRALQKLGFAPVRGQPRMLERGAGPERYPFPSLW